MSNLIDYNSNEYLGEATDEQIEASRAAGEVGAITIDADTGEVLHPGADKAVWPNQRTVYVDLV